MPYTPRESRVVIQTLHPDGSYADVDSDSIYLCVHLHAPCIHVQYCNKKAVVNFKSYGCSNVKFVEK